MTRTVSGTHKSTKSEWLPVLSNIAPPAIQRDVLSSRYFCRILTPEIPAQHIFVEHPYCHLKSQKPPWNHTELLTVAHQSEATCGGPAGWLPQLLIIILYIIQPFLHPVSQSYVGNGQPSTSSTLDSAIVITHSIDGG